MLGPKKTPKQEIMERLGVELSGREVYWLSEFYTAKYLEGTWRTEVEVIEFVVKRMRGAFPRLTYDSEAVERAKDSKEGDGALD